jgi:hypothetical protein
MVNWSITIQTTKTSLEKGMMHWALSVNGQLKPSSKALGTNREIFQLLFLSETEVFIQSSSHISVGRDQTEKMIRYEHPNNNVFFSIYN